MLRNSGFWIILVGVWCWADFGVRGFAQARQVPEGSPDGPERVSSVDTIHGYREASFGMALHEWESRAGVREVRRPLWLRLVKEKGQVRYFVRKEKSLDCYDCSVRKIYYVFESDRLVLVGFKARNRNYDCLYRQFRRQHSHPHIREQKLNATYRGWEGQRILAGIVHSPVGSLHFIGDRAGLLRAYELDQAALAAE